MWWSGLSMRVRLVGLIRFLQQHHWLGHRLTGQVMRYVAVLDGQWVALVGFGSAVLSCAARDRYLGWSRELQYARLRHVVNNQRFCVLPAGQRDNLASAVLSRVLRRVSRDYLAGYGHRVLAVETFTDPARHTGACYAAANFVAVGDTLGYSRSAGSYHYHGQRKRVWLYRLHRDMHTVLCAPFPHPLLSTESKGVDVNALAIAGEGGLLSVLEELTDPRKKRGIRHRVATILTMAAAATLAGHRSFRSVAEWVADLPQEALARFGARQAPMTGRYIAPSEATIRRTVQDIDADEADTLIGSWLWAQVHAGRLAAEQTPSFIGLAIDAKTLKGSWPEINTGATKVRLFSALVHSEGVVVGQRAIPAGTGETTQVLPLLDTIAAAGAGGKPGGRDDPPELADVVVTADALHVHRDNIEGLLDRGGEYVLTVKGNQPKLRAAIADLFSGPDADFPPSPHHLRSRPRP